MTNPALLVAYQLFTTAVCEVVVTSVHVIPPHPPEGVCHVAEVPEVAVNTCPDVGAVEEETFIFVVVLARFCAVVDDCCSILIMYIEC